MVDLVAGQELTGPLPVASAPIVEATSEDVLDAVGAKRVPYMARALAAARLTRTTLEILFPPYDSERHTRVSAMGLNLASYGREIAPEVARFLLEERAPQRVVDAAGAKRHEGVAALQFRAARDAARGMRRRQRRLAPT